MYILHFYIQVQNEVWADVHVGIDWDHWVVLEAMNDVVKHFSHLFTQQHWPGPATVEHCSKACNSTFICHNSPAVASILWCTWSKAFVRPNKRKSSMFPCKLSWTRPVQEKTFQTQFFSLLLKRISSRPFSPSSFQYISTQNFPPGSWLGQILLVIILRVIKRYYGALEVRRCHNVRGDAFTHASVTKTSHHICHKSAIPGAMPLPVALNAFS